MVGNLFGFYPGENLIGRWGGQRIGRGGKILFEVGMAGATEVEGASGVVFAETWRRDQPED
jgi:hypothetical protein